MKFIEFIDKKLNNNSFVYGRIIRRIIILLIFILVVVMFMMLSSGKIMKNTQVLSFAQDTSDDVMCDSYENRIAITFDDGPNPKTTPKLLDGLKERGVKATFFLIGESAAKNNDLVKRIYDEGHLIGNHTYSHVQLNCLGIDKAREEIIKANEEINKITGKCPQYIRPPYGSYSNKLLMEVNMIPVLWTVDPKDWNTDNTSKVVRFVVENAKCGDIILLHDIYDTSVAAALEIIDQLKAKGYVFVTVDQIILD